MSPADPAPPAYRAAVLALAWFVALTAVAVFVVGWEFDVSVVRASIPGAVAMKPLTAVGLAAGACAVLLLAGPHPCGVRGLGLALAIVPGALGAAVLAEYLLGTSLHIDELLFVDHAGRASGIAYPGRFAPTTGACFLLLSTALLCLDFGRSWRWRLSELLALPIIAMASMSLIGYSYAIPAFYGPAAAAKMALNTAFCFLALGIAVTLLRPRGRILELATTTDPGGVMVRRMVPYCVVVPLVLGWLHLRMVGWGFLDPELAAWWVAAATVVGLVGMMWVCAGTLSRSDRRRREVEAENYALAHRDPLTGLFNRHRFEEEVEAFLARGRRSGETGTLLLFDLDRLKPVNDVHGHAAGDALLRAVADAVTARLRKTDIVARLGGDEFAVLLPGADIDAARVVGEELLASIAAIDLPTAEGSAWTSASIGLARVAPGVPTAPTDLLAQADTAMYRAKRAGGNRVDATTLPAPT